MMHQNIVTGKIDVQDGKIIIPVKYPKKSMDFVDNMKNMQYDIEIKEHREKRSLNANAYHWVLCQKIADALGVDNETVHFEMLIKYGYSDKVKILQEAVPRLERDFKYVTVEKEYEEKGYNWAIVKIHHRSMYFNTKEMSRLIEGTVADAKDLGIETMTPAELAELKRLWGEEQCQKDNY